MMSSPKYESLDEALLPKMFNKSFPRFKVIEDRLSKLISKTCEPNETSRCYFKSTEISQEVIDCGFTPFDMKNFIQPTITAKSEKKRENLKQLIHWLCEQFTSSCNPLQKKFDLLNGKKPSYYGLSCKDGKFLFLEKWQ